MPTYRYKCTECSHEFELFQYITDEPIKTCPKCKCKVERLIRGGAGLLFKGKGFYITDYRSDSYKNKAKAEKNEAKAEKNNAKAEKSDKSASASPDTSKKVNTE